VSDLGLRPALRRSTDGAFITDNCNVILDCGVGPLADPSRLEDDIQRIPGVVGTGFFLKMADVVLVGDNRDFRLVAEKTRS